MGTKVFVCISELVLFANNPVVIFSYVLIFEIIQTILSIG